MSKAKLNENLFLGKQELSRIVKFLDEDGFRKFFFEDTVSCGFVNKNLLGDFKNGKVELGTNALTIKVNETKIIDKNINFLYKALEDNLSIPNDGQWYWVQAQYIQSNIEVGTFQIDIQGNLTGSGGKLTEVLRGKPDHASVIKFANSSFNLLEYEVTDIIDDNNAVLAGEFTAETNLKVIVVGTFDPIALSSNHKNIFLYDSLQLNINLETTLNTPPIVQQDILFNLARVSVQSGQVVIQDKRTEFWETKGASLLSKMTRTGSKIFGIEAVKFDHPNTVLLYNFVEVGWGFRSTNWTINTSLNRVSISGGQGGQFEDSNAFTTGDFDGWRLYTKEGLFSIIKSSVKSGTQFNLELDTLDPDRFIDSSQELIIVPNVDSIEIAAKADPADGTDLPDKIFSFPINKGKVRLDLLCYKDLSKYNIKYRYKNHFQYSEWFLPITDSNSRYLTEGSFTNLGVLKPLLDRVYKNYTSHATNGFIELVLNPSSYVSFVSKVDLGDRAGVEYIDNLENVVFSAPSRKVDFIVGTRKQLVIITGSDSLTGDSRFNLVTTGVREGAVFYIYVKVPLDNTPNQYSLRIYQDNSVLLYTFTQDEIAKGEQFFKCTFDGTNWQITHFDKDYNGDGVFKEGAELLNTIANVTTVSGKTVLIASGYYEHIILENNTTGFKLDSIVFLNRKFINNLKISLTGTQSVEFNNLSAPASVAPNTYKSFNIYGDIRNRVIYPGTPPFVLLAGANGDVNSYMRIGYSSVFQVNTLLHGALSGVAVANSFGTANDNWMYVSNVDNDTIKIRRSSTSQREFTTILNPGNVQLKYDLPNDGVWREYRADVDFMHVFADGLSEKMSWGISFGNTVPSLNEEYLVKGMWQYERQDPGTGSVAEIFTDQSSILFVHDGGPGKSIRVHLREINSINCLVFRVRLKLIGFPL